MKLNSFDACSKAVNVVGTWCYLCMLNKRDVRSLMPTVLLPCNLYADIDSE